MKKPIYVTQPTLPPLNEFYPYLEMIWKNNILTNNGPIHQQLENELCRYLGVDYISLFNNGTVALITALQALKMKQGGEIITTPYTFIATAHSIVWNKFIPVFVDINRETTNIDVEKIEAAITENTVAIMPVHCYGIPCDVIALDSLAKKYNLKLIYDAAHAFDVRYEGQSLLNYGDLSVISFHATKVFNTFEGGAVVSHSKQMKEYIDQLKNFGFKNETNVDDISLNGKLSEVHAAMGLLQLKYLKENLSKRAKVDKYYRELLKSIIGIQCIQRGNVEQDNYAYFPIIVNEAYKLSRDELMDKLKANGIYARKYFYPILTEFDCYTGYDTQTPTAQELSEKIICLPMYPTLTVDNVRYIAQIIGDENG